MAEILVEMKVGILAEMKAGILGYEVAELCNSCLFG